MDFCPGRRLGDCVSVVGILSPRLPPLFPSRTPSSSLFSLNTGNSGSSKDLNLSLPCVFFLLLNSESMLCR